MLAKTELSPERQGLADAADLIEKCGWWNGEGGKRGDRYCALLAIGECATETTIAYNSIKLFKKHIGDQRIPVWNDQQLNAETVICALREAAYS